MAAGFVRNLVWDHLHNKPVSTPLNDIDVIYFDADEADNNMYLKYEKTLTILMPQVNWEVRNQAKMHARNGDQPYQNILDSMSYWPEKETAVAIRKIDHNQYECISAFGLDSLFNYCITHNPKRNIDIFEGRLNSKDWLIKWPMLKVNK